MTHLALIAHNIRSCHNVGALLRTAEGLGVGKVYLTGYTPYPTMDRSDPRLPHLARKIDAEIHKTALGAERMVAWEAIADIDSILHKLCAEGFALIALEQDPNAISLPDFRPSAKTALIVGREVEGIEPEILTRCDHILEIPMSGQKESFNVSAAAAMALYHMRFANVISGCESPPTTKPFAPTSF